MTSLRVLCGALAGALLIAGNSTAMSQAWPARGIQVISPFTAGNANDTVARIVLEQVSRQLGQSIVVENRPGGGGTIGVAAVAKAEPDGYTILMHSSSFAAALVLHKSLPYDTLKDFAPVAMFGIQPSVLVTAPSKGFKTVADLVAAAKAKPGALNYASAGIGAASHMAAERLRLATGIVAQHIPFRGPVEALTEVISGRIDFYFLPIAPALAQINDGKLTALAVSTPTRRRCCRTCRPRRRPAIRTPPMCSGAGCSCQRRRHAPSCKKLHDETRKALDVASVQERLAKLGVQPMPMNIEQFDKFFRDDVAATVKLGKDVGITATD